ncbi:MAG: IS66 family transposase [Oscillospiraceae bacterium]|nr:IS66 family transposase [Oscillospiraceae bacterium]
MPKEAYDALMQQLSVLQATVERLTATIEEKDRIIAEKIEIILNQNRARFGQSSEKRAYVLCDGQTSMFDQAGDGITEKTPEETADDERQSVRVAAHTRKAKRTLEEFAANLEERVETIDLPEEQKVTADGRPLKYVGVDLVRSELVREPSKAYIRKIFIKTYADPKAEEETGRADLRRPHVPAPLLPHSYASASVVTDIIVKKFADALPLYRQEQMWKRLGVDLKRNTMARWVVLTAETYLKPFSDAFLRELLRQAVIHADETVLQVNREPGRAATEESRIWVYASSKLAERKIRYFRYEPSRKGACAEEVLRGFHGVLVCDGYSGYNVVSDVTRAGCWAHMRRKWREAMPKGATLENSFAARGFDFCDRLFALEREFEGLSDKARAVQRQLRSKPIVDEYYAWLETIFRPTGKLKDAVRYAVNQRPYLCAFLDHGEIEISNNQVENAIRPIVVGRKNWLFCDTQAGAHASVIVYTVLETAKANGLNPETYLKHLLDVLPDRFAADPQAPVDDLMPWTERIQEMFRASDTEY